MKMHDLIALGRRVAAIAAPGVLAGWVVAVSAESYVVTARRWEHGWELHIADAAGDEIGVTQSRTLAGADRMIRDYLAIDGRDAAADVKVRPQLGAEETERVQRARRMIAEAEAAQREAAAESRRVVQDLKASGLSGSDIAHVLHLSTQRVSQLASAGKD